MEIRLFEKDSDKTQAWLRLFRGTTGNNVYAAGSYARKTVKLNENMLKSLVKQGENLIKAL